MFQEEIRLASWNLINGQLRPTYLKNYGTRLRARISLGAIDQAISEWFKLATWLEGRGIYRLADCDTDVLHDYGERCRDSGVGRQQVYKILGMLTRLWAFDQLSARPNGIGRPPWEEAGVDDYLPAATTLGEIGRAHV